MKSNWKEIVLHIFFPRCCPICNKLLKIQGEKICPICVRKIKFVTEPRCKCCGKGVHSKEVEYCFDCNKKVHNFKEGISLCYYTPLLQKSLAQVKYYNKRQHLDFYCEEMFRVYKRKIHSWGIDIIIPVPLHPKRRRKRGFNQAEEIGRRLSKLFQIPMNTHILFRVSNTKAQKDLNNKESQKNLQGAFLVKKKLDENIKRVLLVDDIYTTGSTVDECAKELLLSGVKQVYVATIAIGKGY